MLRWLLVLAVLFVVPSITAARTWHILPDGTGDAPTIQAGVDSAAAGDTVLVACGAYYEHDIEIRDDLVIRSQTGLPDCATIDAGAQGRGFAAENVSFIRLEGLTIRNGKIDGQPPPPVGGPGGGGLFAVGFVSLEISDCVFANCYGWVIGGAVVAEGSRMVVSRSLFDHNAVSASVCIGGALYGSGDLLLTDCAFVGNSATEGLGFGGAVSWTNTPMEAERCVFLDNSASFRAGAIEAPFGVHIKETLFRGNSCNGDGLVLRGGTSYLEQCVFVENSVPGSPVVTGGPIEMVQCTVSNNIGSGIALAAQASFDRRITHTIVTGNTGAAVTGVATTIGCTNIYGNGTNWDGAMADWDGVAGNFSADPLFCDPDNGDFMIQSDSPCAPPGVTGCGLIGALPVGCGPVAVEAESWATIKARYR